MAPTIKIQQIILPNVVDDVNFIRVPKMDRCQTCHLAIDKKGYEKYPQPFTTHPNLDAVSRWQLAAPDRQGRLHGVPRGHGSVGELPDAVAHADRREAEGRVGKDVPLGRTASVGLPDAADEDDGSVVREVPQAADYIPKAESLNVAYATFERAGCYACHKTKGFDADIRSEARTDPHEDRLEADAGLGEELDSQSARRQADDLDAAFLLQLEQQLARRTRSATKSRSTRSSRISSRTPTRTTSRGQEPAARRREERRGDRQVDRLPGMPRGGRGQARGGRPAAHLRPAAREHRQQDDLRVDLQLGPRSEALQPGHLHAEPAPDRSSRLPTWRRICRASRAAQATRRRPRRIRKRPTTSCSTT